MTDRRTPILESPLEIRPGTQVISRNTLVGRVQHVILRPAGDVEGLIVSGWIVLGHDVYIPIEAVEGADHQLSASGVAGRAGFDSRRRDVGKSRRDAPLVSRFRSSSDVPACSVRTSES